ncbi:MAG TPA: hypothetical protein VGC09_09380 [Rhodopila sp.]
MKTWLLASLASLCLGMGIANAATLSDRAPVQQGNNYNFLQGGGG